jgi:hypothetical protein
MLGEQMENTRINIEHALDTQSEKEELCIPLATALMSACKVRLNLSLPQDFMIYIKDLAKINHQIVTGAILAIILFHKTMHNFVKNGYKISIEDSTGKSHYLLINATV